MLLHALQHQMHQVGQVSNLANPAPHSSCTTQRCLFQGIHRQGLQLLMCFLMLVPQEPLAFSKRQNKLHTGFDYEGNRYRLSLLRRY